MVASPTSAPPAQTAPETADKRPQWAQVTLAGNLKALAIFALLMFALCWVFAPDLMRDRRLANTYVIDMSVDVREGSCRNMFFLVSTCQIRLGYEAADGSTRQVSTYQLYGLGSMGGKPMIPVRSSVDPDAVSITLAVEDHITNRVVTFVVVFGLLVMMLLMGLWRIVSGRYIGGRAFVAQFGPVPA